MKAPPRPVLQGGGGYSLIYWFIKGFGHLCAVLLSPSQPGQLEGNSVFHAPWPGRLTVYDRGPQLSALRLAGSPQHQVAGLGWKPRDLEGCDLTCVLSLSPCVTLVTGLLSGRGLGNDLTEKHETRGATF